MRICITTALDNGVGLAQDFQILKRLCESAGHEVTGAHHRKGKPQGRFDLAIFAETFVPGWEDLAPIRWVLPNPEWWFAYWNPYIPAFDRVLCKTHDTERIFFTLGARTVYTGFEAADRLDTRVDRERRFLHVAGESLLKGTQAIVDAWDRHGIQHQLTIVSRKMKVRAKSKMVLVKARLSDVELRDLQNRCLFHLQPSSYEGFGHVLHESLSCGALLATTDAPPMAELGVAARHLIKPASWGEHQLARLALVDADGVAAAVEALARFEADADKRLARQVARNAYEREVENFRATFLELLEEAARGPAPPPPPKPRVAIIFPAHASAHELVRRSVLALRWQTATPDSYECVVAADGGDPDGLLQNVVLQANREDLPGQPFECRLVESPRTAAWGDVPHRNHARNAGWRESRASLCWMIDSDFILPSHAVEHLLAEHAAAVTRGRPAVFSPCLAGVGAISTADWLARSVEWAAGGGRESFDQALECGGVSPCFGGYPELYAGPGRPRSLPLEGLPEGMPVIPRALLEALGGFDQDTFGRWGGDKEELVDRIRGCATAGLVEVRLLSSVQALHQPHPADPSAFSDEAKPRQRERERRARLIQKLDPWWLERLDKVRAALPVILDGICAASGAPPGALDGVALAEVPMAVARAVRLLRGVRGRYAAAGRGAKELAAALADAGVNAEIVGDGELGERKWAGFVAVDLLGPLEEEAMLAESLRVRRAVGPGGKLLLFERTKLGMQGPDLRPPIVYQRLLPGLCEKGSVVERDVTYTVFLGSLVR